MRRLPTGTVTFLFTDIEGSTRLLHELGERYAEVLASHRRVLREAFERHGGVEVDTQGDAFFVAFARVTDALGAASEGQAELAEGPVRVRMGLHTGEPTLTDEGYVGMDVHKGARIAAAGHGGQVLLSDQTARLAAGAELRDLGEHRLKDLAGVERIFQLGDGEFPPLKTLHQTSLPVPANPLVGRKKELAAVLRLLTRERVRVVTVVGPGGIGKTRFAVAAATEAADAFPDGVCFVPLAPVRSVEHVLPAIATALQVETAPAAHIREHRQLLVLDNFEQVVEAAEDLAALLASCPNLQLLVTSRQPLRIEGEHEYPLRPLPEAPAVELFRQRANALLPDLEVDYEVASAICARVDGLPLAIELAAARIKVFDPPALLERLERRLPLLSNRRRDLPQRQRTLHATIEWSYELLAPEERELFRGFAVFAGGATLEAIEALLPGSVDVIESLIDKSLVRRRGERFTMLETIREYAAEQLESSGDAAAARGRHAAYFVGAARAADADARDAWRDLDLVQEADRFAWFDREENNLRAALGHLRGEGPPEVLLELAVALAGHWRRQGQVVEGARELDAALAAAEDVDPRLRLRALIDRMSLAWRAGEPEEAERLADDALALADSLGARESRGWVLLVLANASVTERPERADVLLDEIERIFGELGFERGIRSAINCRANLRLATGDYEGARVLLGRLAPLPGRSPEPVHVLNEGLVALMQGRNADAGELYRDAVARADEVGDTTVLLGALDGTAAVSARTDPEVAARLLGATDAAREALGLVVVVPELRARDLAVATARERLGESRYASAYEDGRKLPSDDAVRLALASIDSLA